MDTAEIINANKQEGNRLEYKGPGARPDSILKELVAFANTDGGTLLIGITENDDSLSVEGVADDEDPSGLEEWLHNKIRDTVEPDIEIGYTVETHAGETLIRIDVDPHENLHSFEPSNKPVFPYRSGSSTGYVGGYELTQRAEASIRTEGYSDAIPEDGSDSIGDGGDSSQTDIDPRSPARGGGAFRSTTIESTPQPTAPMYSAPSNRIITETGGHRITTFGGIGLSSYHPPRSTVRVADSIQLGDGRGLEDLIRQIQETLNIDSYRSGAYAIKYGSRQIIGRGMEQFLVDANRIPEICNRLLPGSQTAGESPRPIGMFTMPLPIGQCIIETQWDGEQLRTGRSSVQILLDDIPFDDAPYQQLFTKLGGAPATYQSQHWIHLLSLSGTFELEHTEVVSFEPNTPHGHTEIIATNPFYEDPSVVQSAFETQLPKPMIEVLTGINQIAFDVAGGWNPKDEAFRFDRLELLQIDGMLDTFVLSGLCRVSETELDEPDVGLGLGES